MGGVIEARRANRVSSLARRSDPLPSGAASRILPKPQQAAARQVIAAWCEDRRGGLYLHGPTGVGKTLLASRAAHYLRSRGVPVLFVKAKRALDGLREFDIPAFGYSSLAAEWRSVMERAEVLVLDDLGAHRVTEYAIEELVAVFDVRYEQRSPTIVTSNFDPVQLADAFGDRLFDRVRGLCKPVELKGESLR